MSRSLSHILTFYTARTPPVRADVRIIALGTPEQADEVLVETLRPRYPTAEVKTMKRTDWEFSKQSDFQNKIVKVQGNDESFAEYYCYGYTPSANGYPPLEATINYNVLTVDKRSGAH